MVIGRLVSSRRIAQQSVLVSKETTNRAKADSMAEASVFTIITRRVNRKRTSILHDCASSERAGGIIFARRVNVPMFLTLSLTAASRDDLQMDSAQNQWT